MKNKFTKESRPFPCGKCIGCLKERARQWSIRLSNQLLYTPDAVFLTLTYNDDSIPLDDNGLPILVKRDVQLFLKRLRKHFKDKKIKYFLCGEYGSKTHRPHYHAIVFGVELERWKLVNANLSKTQWSSEVVQRIWSHGHNVIGICNEKTINYVTGYVCKTTRPEERMQIQSQGLGLDYVFDNEDKIRNLKMTRHGKRVSVPRYYLKKLGVTSEDIERIVDERNLEQVSNESDNNDVSNEVLGKYFRTVNKQRERNLSYLLNEKERKKII